MSLAEIVHMLKRLREMPLETRRQVAGLNPTRADIIVAGATVVARLANYLGSQQIVVNDRGIRDGLLLSMTGRCRGLAIRAVPPKDRIEMVRAFAIKCRSNERHCEQVARLAGMIFDGLGHAFALPASSREILQAAALLHEIGYLINHSKHHKHAYHLIMHGELPGFSAREVELIANVARYQRRATPKKSHENFRRLDRQNRRLVKHLSGILRVADGLDRTHSQSVESLSCDFSGRNLRIVLESLSDPEVEIWDAERKAELFESAFGVRLELVWSEDAKRQSALTLHPILGEPSRAVGA